MDKGYRFVTDCIGSTYEAISALKETEQSISRRTFREYVGPEEWKDLQQRLGYDRDFPIARDWHVGYYKGVYLGKPAVFVRWSGIEYIFVRPR
jgi:hypothetical protein